MISPDALSKKDPIKRSKSLSLLLSLSSLSEVCADDTYYLLAIVSFKAQY
jgi:hypothetical protein